MSTLDAYHLISEFPHVGLVHFSNDGKIFDVTDGFCHLVGATRAELIKQNIKNLLHPDDKLDAKEVRFQKKNSSIFWAQVSIKEVTDKKGRPIFYVCFIQDITRQKLAKLELDELKLNRSDKLSRGMIHQINNPLTIIHARARHILDMVKSGSEPEEVAHCAERIEMAVDRILKLVQALDTTSDELDEFLERVN